MSGNDAWSSQEVDAVVADYLHMLALELAGQGYNKTAHRRALQLKLQNRSDGSIERKHQNISAILIQLGCPYVSGYKPLYNYQSILFDTVEHRVANDLNLDRSALSAAELPAVMPLAHEINMIVEPAPVLNQAMEQKKAVYQPSRQVVQRDYFEREARNRSLGLAGEEFIMAYERYRLHSFGKSSLIDKVEHVSKTKGDGLGFDVLSFEPDGRERFIEVKTTSFGKETPFFISRNEVDFSEEYAAQFHLYRLFEFRRHPRMFELNGRVCNWVRLDPISYLARFS